VTAFAGAGLPWPVEPYPGLRPFLEREASLLFGRKRQIAEVIDRLRQTQFVAVLGGSGSGKSSLIHAGVTPELRSYGIHAAGDLWLPTVCTPGTNVSDEDRAAQRHTPVVRLARRFAELLKTRGSEAADAERVDAIAAVFRQDGGFARLMDVFGHELALEPGLRPEDARVLFVLDQFEEVFHPTNADVDDAGRLVQRTLDHFFAPHPRCYVVLTMRSEHLNDCAGYLELPDAINKSSYLVRRLDENELEEAIVGPTEHFLRLMQLKRQRDEDRGVDVQALPPLPAQVQFERAVIDRLLKDVGDITYDPDHLPLLQHLLARLWQVAQARRALELDVAVSSEVVPAHVTAVDLHCAVTAERVPARPLSAGNALRAAVDAWPSAALRKFSQAEREAIDEVLRRLAFKDPKTGMYSQQRLRVHSESPRILGAGKTAEDLHLLLSERFLGSVNYLYWDRRDPDNVTLKVSHEALIRGWAHFQKLVDGEFHHYESFVALLRECAKWLDTDQSRDALLRRIELQRLQRSPLLQRLAAPGLRALWLRSLRRERDAERLTSVAPALDDFLQRSTAQVSRDRAQTLVLRLGYGVVGVAAIALYNVYLVGPYTQRLNDVFEASLLTNSVELTVVQAAPDPQRVHPALQPLLQAAEILEVAKEQVREDPNRLLGVDDQVRVIRNVVRGLEPAVNGRLRQVLTSTVFAVLKPPGQALLAPKSENDVTCRSDRDPSISLRGELLLDQTNWVNPYRRALLRVVAEDGVLDTILMAASAKPDFSDCTYGAQIVRLPGRLKPHAVVDSDLQFLIYALHANRKLPYAESDASVTVVDLGWERSADQRLRLLPMKTRSVISESSPGSQGSQGAAADSAEVGPPAFVAQVAQAAGQRPLAAVPTWRTAGGRTLQVGQQYWRLVSADAQRLHLVPTLGADPLVALRSEAAAATASAASGPSAQPAGFREQTLFDDHGVRVQVTYDGDTPTPLPSAQAGGGPRLATQPEASRLNAFVAVYTGALAAPAGLGQAQKPGSGAFPVASFSPFGSVRVEEGLVRWYLVRGGDCDGWLMSAESGEDRFLAAPWSTAALHRLGHQVDVARRNSEVSQVGCVTPEVSLETRGAGAPSRGG
jgi:hypothetical protein